MAISENDKKLILEKVISIMKKYKGKLMENKSLSNGYELIGNTPKPYGSSKKIVPGMYFASTTSRKNSVVFYFFPCYTQPQSFKKVAPQTMKCLEGKTCFHFTDTTQVVEKEIAAMFQLGIEFYKKEGWIK